jgi:type I restriction enzyme S subunit
VPEGWVWTTLGEISNYGDSDNVDVSNIDGNAWILELEDIEKNSANIYTKLLRKERNINGVRHKFNKGYILYSKLRTYLNKVLVAPSDGFCTTEIMSFYTFNVLSNEYLCNVLRSQYFLDYTLQCGYGVKMPRLSTTDACNGLIPLPPLREQLRIVAEIEKWFAFIDVIELSKDDLQNTIKQAKSKILDLAIHGKLVPQDPNDEPAMELLRRINPKAEITCDNAHYPFEVPSGWAWTTLGTICKFISGYAFSSNDYSEIGTKLIRISNIQSNVIDLNSCVCVEDPKIDSLYVKRGDLLIAMSGATTGKMGVYSEEEPALLNQRVGNIRIIDDSVLLAEYRNYFMNSMSDYILESAYGGAQPNISAKEISVIALPLPPIAEQQRIVAKIEELFLILDNIQNSLEV